jgi:hypothetical protein
MRWVFYTILPSGYIAFVPLAVYRGLDWRLVPVLISVAILCAGLFYALFRAGRKRYGSGNQMGARAWAAAGALGPGNAIGYLCSSIAS